MTLRLEPLYRQLLAVPDMHYGEQGRPALGRQLPDEVAVLWDKAVVPKRHAE